jgi:hypothetical protein
VRRVSSAICVRAAASLVAVLACDKAPPDGSRTPEPFVVITVPAPGQIIDLNAFRSQFKLRKKGHTRFRIADGPPPCSDNCGTAVEITAYSGAKEVVETAGPQNTVALAHVSNVGLWPTKEGLYPGSKAKLDRTADADYEIVVDNSGPNKAAKWRLLRVPNAPRGSVTEVESGKMTLCQGHPPKNESEADFSDCSRVHPLDAEGISKAGFPLFDFPVWLLTKLAPFGAADVEPVWVSCSMGCCTLGV